VQSTDSQLESQVQVVKVSLVALINMEDLVSPKRDKKDKKDKKSKKQKRKAPSPEAAVTDASQVKKVKVWFLLLFNFTLTRAISHNSRSISQTKKKVRLTPFTDVSHTLTVILDPLAISSRCWSRLYR
jgi:hypothetical protein